MKHHLNAITSSLRQWYHFKYFVQGHEDRERYPHQTRDEGAALFLQRVLLERGFVFRGPVYNYPANPETPGERYEVDDSFLRAGDLLVLTTRPPLDDLKDGHRGPVERSYTTLEEKVFGSLRKDFVHVSRMQVTVADVHARSSQGVARLQNVQFRQNRGAAVDSYQSFGTRGWRRPQDPGTTLAYLVYKERAWVNGPGVLASFGMCGTDTLAWNYLLATKYPELVASVPFVMAEIATRRHPGRPLTADFVLDWDIQLLTESQCVRI